MNDEYFAFQLETRREKTRSKVNAGRFGALQPGSYLAETGFKCGHCHVFISAEAILSGVNNRNHCPYCLWSKHLDLYQAGDRLAACKSLMRPVGLALKRTRNKYGVRAAGELMLVHLCVDCEKVSLNRIAADDIVERVWEIYTDSCAGHVPDVPCAGSELALLDNAAQRLVRAQLFGDL
jgi:hypothetical protein